MSESPMLLHVYGQDAWHAPVRIVGTRDALEHLAIALMQAVYGLPQSAKTFFVNDGEGFQIDVICMSEKEMDGEPRPYTADYARRDK